MKFNKLAARAKNTALFSLIMTMVACQSDEQKAAQMDSEIARIEAQIDSTYKHNEVTDSAARNHVFRTLNEQVEQDSERIDSLLSRNWELSESMRDAKIRRIAKKYPLSKFFSGGALKIIQAQLRSGNSNSDAANRIIAGRGTLLDLYAVSFDLRFEEIEPFYIMDPCGTVRFGDDKLDALCQKFDDEKWAILIAPQANKEILANESEINAHNRKREMRDSIYADIESHFMPQITHRIDSLKNKKEQLMIKKFQLAQRMNARRK